MQTLGTYLLQAVVEPGEAEERIARFEKLATDWLIRKGSDNPHASDGEFRSKSGDGTGLFSRSTLKTSAGELHELQLDETASNGDIFTTQVKLSHYGGRVNIFAALGSAPTSVAVTNGSLHPKCPSIIRELIDAYDDWRFGEQSVPRGGLRVVRTEDDVFALCDDLFLDERRLPLVVVSSDPDGSVWSDLATDLAIQLVGLAEVADVNREAAWTLTGELDKPSSCYRGAVRLYWPGVRKDNRLRSQLWGSDRQSTFGTDEIGKRRFLSMMRKTVLTAAALTINEPRDMHELRLAAAKDRLASEGIGALKARILELEEQTAKLKAELAIANQQHAHTKYQFAAYKEAHGGAGESEAANDEDVEIGPPEKGETRYYKKTGTGGGVDRMARRGPCNHNSWKPAFAGEQAEKGIAKLEGRANWQSLAKCGGCKGGGFWRVTW